MAGVSAIVVNWNGGSTVVATVRSLLQHRPSSPFEVIVVDNGSTDGSPDVLASTFAARDVRVQRNERNLGLAAANNQGIATARHDRLLICNPDVLVGAGTVDALLACLERHPRAAWCVPRLRRPDGSMQTAVGDLPRLGDALLGRRWTTQHSGDRRGFWWDRFEHDEEVAVGHAMECCYLVRREAVEAFGAQDERYRLDWEGIDWAARAGAAGWEIWFCPEAEVVHLGLLSEADAEALLARRLGPERAARDQAAVNRIAAACGRLPLALTLVGMRARTGEGVAKLSAFAQSTGYLISIPGPLLVGVLYQHSGGWGLPLALMAALMVPQIAVGALAGRDRMIEDETAATGPRAGGPTAATC